MCNRDEEREDEGFGRQRRHHRRRFVLADLRAGTGRREGRDPLPPIKNTKGVCAVDAVLFVPETELLWTIPGQIVSNNLASPQFSFATPRLEQQRRVPAQQQILQGIGIQNIPGEHPEGVHLNRQEWKRVESRGDPPD